MNFVTVEEKQLFISTKNIVDERIRSLFNIALSNYEFKSGTRINLVKTSIKGSTMQAQPVFQLKSLFTGLNTYRIRLAEYVRGSETMKVEELPDDVLIGWFAHELGHVLDYQNQSFLGMIGYGIKYIFSKAFRKKIEHRADQIAIEHGFHKEVLATKRFLFTHEGIDPTYRMKMKRFYMPMRDVEEWIEKNISIDPVD